MNKCQDCPFKKDLEAVKTVARQYGFSANDTETSEGIIRNVLAVLVAERDLKRLGGKKEEGPESGSLLKTKEQRPV